MKTNRPKAQEDADTGKPLGPAPVEGLIRAPEDNSKLTRDEKRRLLAQIVRFNPAECFDESGTLDLDRVREVSGAVFQQMVVQETTRTSTKGAVTTQRRITLRLVDKVRALGLDEKLQDREEAEEQAKAKSEESQKAFEEGQKRAKALLKEMFLGPDWAKRVRAAREGAAAAAGGENAGGENDDADGEDAAMAVAPQAAVAMAPQATASAAAVPARPPPRRRFDFADNGRERIVV